jgi:hypothetical protein
MDKINKVFLHPFAEDMGPNPAYGETVSDPDLNINQRVAQLLMLLQQLDESAGGLETLPTPELGEIVSSALGLCGFEDPIEARAVFATVLEAIERPDPIPEVPRFGSVQVRHN